MRSILLASLALALSFAPEAAARGSTIPTPPGNPGPGDVPPEGGSGATPPPATPGPSTPGASGPSTPGPSTPSSGGTARPTPPPSSGGPAAPGAPAGSGPATIASTPVTRDSWRVWWLYNRDLYLGVKDAVYRAAPTTGRSAPFLGFGSQEEEEGSGRVPGDAQIAEVLLPALLDVWNEPGSELVRRACIAAVSQIGHHGTHRESEDVARLLREGLGASNRETAEVSAAAFGLLGSRQLVPALCDLLLDTEAGRQLSGDESVPARTRAYAAYGLAAALRRDGVVDIRSFVQGKVLEALAADEGRTPDLGVACVTTLGVLGELAQESGELANGESSTAIGRRGARATALMSLLFDERANRTVRAHVPRALARQVDDDESPLRSRVIGALVDGLQARHREIRYGCTQALGMLGDCDDDADDAKLRKALLRLAKDGDLYDRNFARIALGEVAGRSGGPASRVADARAEIQGLLLRDLGGRKNQLRPWAALSLGVMAHGLRAEGAPVAPAVTSALRLSLEGARTPEEIGAFALALGLARDNTAGEALLAKLEGTSDDDTKGWLALALGMVDAREALPVLEEELAESLRRPELMLNASIALALLGDEDVARPLVATLLAEPTSEVAAGVARALGFVGDAHAVAPLLEVLGREQLGDRTRSYVVVALGLVGDRERVPWTRPFAEHLNYLALTDTLHSQQGSGVLNIR